jgi:regulator of replication initiation timing
MATKAEEEALRLSVGRFGEGVAELLRDHDSMKADIASLKADNAALKADNVAIKSTLDKVLALLSDQVPAVLQFSEFIKAELTEVARSKAEKVAGKSALLSLFSDARVMAVIVSFVTGVCVAILSYFGVLPHAN